MAAGEESLGSKLDRVLDAVAAIDGRLAKMERNHARDIGELTDTLLAFQDRVRKGFRDIRTDIEALGNQAEQHLAWHASRP
jgi:hypothetical protein